MEKARKILGSKIFRLALIFVFIFLIGVFFIVKEKINIARAGDEDDNISGWAWSENFGWFSGNCSNAGTCPSSDVPIDYGLNLENDRTVTGYLWSENVGWVRFSNPDGEKAPDNSVAKATYDSFFGSLSGWAKILSLGEDGWVKLDGPSAGSPGGPFHACTDCKNVPVGDPPVPQYQCNICFTDILSDSGTGVGDICSQCSGCTRGTTEDTCTSCTDSTCKKYGVAVDEQSGRIVGWAWNGNIDPKVGAGWINFSPTPGGLGLASPWLETQYSDIYARQGVSSPSAFVELINKYNATYRILSNGDIVNFRSENSAPVGGEVQGFEIFDFPQAINSYTNVFGKIDLPGILAGKYGTVKNIGSSLEIDSLLAGKVYYSNGDLTVDAAKIFNNGPPGNTSGAGLVVVRGNLTITGDISYQGGNVTNLKNLASVGWLVIDDGSGLKGNITISPPVQNLVGAFYAEGKISTGTTGNSRTDVPLTVHGLMLAKEFNFERLWRAPARGSEQVIYDGRALANTPPGMTDLISALPVWREAAP